MGLILDGISEIGAHVKEQSLLIDLVKAFDMIEGSYKPAISLRKDLSFHNKRAQHILSYHLI